MHSAHIYCRLPSIKLIYRHAYMIIALVYFIYNCIYECSAIQRLEPRVVLTQDITKK
jgi:hypothetical protein